MQVKEISFFVPVLLPWGWSMVQIKMVPSTAGWKLLGVEKSNAGD